MSELRACVACHCECLFGLWSPVVRAGGVCVKKLLDQRGAPYKHGSDIIVKAEEVRNSNDNMTFNLSCKGTRKVAGSV